MFERLDSTELTDRIRRHLELLSEHIGSLDEVDGLVDSLRAKILLSEGLLMTAESLRDHLQAARNQGLTLISPERERPVLRLVVSRPS